MAKAPDAFRTISEVSDQLDTPAHVLRFWESKFVQVKPVKRAGGRRYYRPDDVALLAGIKLMLHDNGMTIKGAQKVLREQGVKAVAAMAPMHENPDGAVIDATAVDAAQLVPDRAARDTDGEPTAAEHTEPSHVPHADDMSRRPDDADVPPVSATGLADAPVGDAHTPDTDIVADAPTPAEVTAAHKDAPAAETGAPPTAAKDTGDNVIALPPVARSDLPGDPAPRTNMSSRLLADLATMDRASVAARAQRLGPLVDRLSRLHATMTQG